jgi:hypothetical protein
MTALRAFTTQRAIMSCAALIACALPCLAQTTATCDETLTAPLQPRSFLRIESRPAGLEIVATDQQTIHITCKSGDNNQDPGQIDLRFDPTPDGGKLSIHGSHKRHNNNLQIKIEVPRRTNLSVSMPAGEVRVEDIAGDKSIDLYAGQITISSEHGWNYRTVDASVTIGEVRAPVYDADKGGFFRSISRKDPGGEYRLRAHVTTGKIDLLGKKSSSDSASRPD